MAEQDTAPNLSDGPFIPNAFRVAPAFRSPDPMAERLDALREGAPCTYARVDLDLPMGCPFSLFLVRGYLNDDALPMVGTLVVSRALAEVLAGVLRDADVIEFVVDPRPNHGDPS